MVSQTTRGASVLYKPSSTFSGDKGLGAGPYTYMLQIRFCRFQVRRRSKNSSQTVGEVTRRQETANQAWYVPFDQHFRIMARASRTKLTKLQETTTRRNLMLEHPNLSNQRVSTSKSIPRALPSLSATCRLMPQKKVLGI